MKADVYNANPDDWYCGDSLCKFNTRPGQHTNGGCTCIDRFDKKQMVMAISKLAQERKQLTARADLFDELVEALEHYVCDGKETGQDTNGQIICTCCEEDCEITGCINEECGCGFTNIVLTKARKLLEDNDDNDS